MNFITEEKNEVAVISVTLPKATADNAKEFKNYLLHKISKEEKKKIILDLSAVDFVDSTFLGALVAGLKASMSIKGDIKIFGLQPPVRAMFELTRLYKVFEIFNNEQDAAESF